MLESRLLIAQGLRLLPVLLLVLLAISCSSSPLKSGSHTDSSYSEEELGLLKLATQQIIQLETAKDYKTLYREYASKGFKQRVDLRKFLKLANCTETHLGDFQGFKSDSVKFIRRTEGGRPVELLNLEVERAQGPITERFVFEQEGLGFKVKSFRWLSTNPDFLHCLESLSRNEKPSGIPQVEVKIAPGS